jgi:hypothetical protein
MKPRSFELVPANLQLIGGPHQQPFGTITAVEPGTEKTFKGTLEWSCSNRDFILEPNGATAQVGCYSSGSASVSAKDPKTGETARVTVNVTIMDGGMPR